MTSGKAFGYIAYPPRPDGSPSYAECYLFDGETFLSVIHRGLEQMPGLALHQGGTKYTCDGEVAYGMTAMRRGPRARPRPGPRR